MKYISKKFAWIMMAVLVMTSQSCFNDLNTDPLDSNLQTANNVYKSPESYLSGLAKIYAGFAVSGQQGPAGQPDIEGIDEGFGQYLRGYWYHQELPTDEAVIGWNDQTIKDFHDMDWSASDGFTYAFFSRIFYQISIANEYLRQTTDEKLDARGTDASLKATIKNYRAEARFLRALSYWHALDLFRNVPFGTEADPVGTYVARQIQAKELFSFIESELLAIDADLLNPSSAPYGRANKAAAWTLLSKLYLNAEVYVGENKYANSLQYAEKVLGAGYTLEADYQDLFLADNHLSKEIIFPINFDGLRTRTWGGMTFIIRAGIGGSMDASKSGVAGGWGGTRTTKQFVEKFPSNTTGIVVAPNKGKTKTYTEIYVGGSFQTKPFTSDGTELSLTSQLKNKVYEGHVYLPANSEIIIARFPGLASKLGDNNNDGILESNGANIKVAEEGFYYLVVDLNTGKNTYKLEKRNWSVIGSATSGGWDTDTPFTWDANRKALSVKLNLVAGELKFRSNKEWTVNLGDKGADAILDIDGDNIKIDKDGGYEILLYLDQPDYTFQMNLTSFDRRGFFYKDGQNLEINDITLFTEGYAINKFKNITSQGVRGSDLDFPDTDFPMFRLADVYLTAAEAILRGGGDKAKALEYVNKVRERAYTGKAGNLSLSDLTLDFILDERGRELYWEGQRRTDLVRFNKFTTESYLWAWKGNVKEGKSVESFRNIFPIPTLEMNVNKNLVQNPGY